MITSGPTREYLDPVRFLSNASSGKMGCALANAALQTGWEVVLISGPVLVEYPKEIELHSVVSTEEMHDWALRLFPNCDMVIGAAAPCDYRPKNVSEKKLSKSDFSGLIELVETPDILAALGQIKRPEQILVAFALETHEAKSRALQKMRRKNADFIVVNSPDAINSEETRFDIYDRSEKRICSMNGSKKQLAERLFEFTISTGRFAERL
ncbi:MAG: phosphopantothenoylcysteine decarboxylase [Planctomycetaceae bacterium]|nr:phosphopantothenoylcysteine decarboxylase [Planctomycetaceae bacterium]